MDIKIWAHQCNVGDASLLCLCRIAKMTKLQQFARECWSVWSVEIECRCGEFLIEAQILRNINRGLITLSGTMAFHSSRYLVVEIKTYFKGNWLIKENSSRRTQPLEFLSVIDWKSPWKIDWAPIGFRLGEITKINYFPIKTAAPIVPSYFGAGGGGVSVRLLVGEA